MKKPPQSYREVLPEINIDTNLIDTSVAYKLQRVRNIAIELRRRSSSWYYNWKPPTDREGKSRKHLEFMLCDKKILIAKGAPRSAKTSTAIHYCLRIILGEHPIVKKWNNVETKKVMWVVATTFKKIVDVLMPLFEEQMPMNRVTKVIAERNNNRYGYEFDNGWKIMFKSQEEKIGTFTSADVRIILIDERVDDERVREQLRSRIISTDGIMIFTMDSNEEDQWIDDLSRMEYVRLFEFNIRDNEVNLPAVELERLERELSDVGKERLLNGRAANDNFVYLFDKQGLWNEGNFVELLPNRFSVQGERFISDESGYFRQFKEPEPGVKYVMGFDSASGVGRNSSAIQMFSEYGEQVAMYLDHTTPYIQFPELILLPLLRKYNNALFVPEFRAQGIYISNKVAETYYNIYTDNLHRKDVNKWSKGMDYGIMTTEKNKKEMIDSTMGEIVNQRLMFHCAKTQRQFRAFVEDYSGNQDSQKKDPKYHGTRIKDDEELRFSDDDLVMATLFAVRALVNMNYLNNAARKREIRKTNAMSIDELKRIKIYRQDEPSNNYGGFYF